LTIFITLINVNDGSLIGSKVRAQLHEKIRVKSLQLLPVTMGKVTLGSGWLAARSTEVHFTGTQLTTTNPPSASTHPWMEAIVPGT